MGHSGTINNIGSIFGKSKVIPSNNDQKRIYIDFQEGFPPIRSNQAIVVGDDQPLEVISIHEDKIILRSRAAD